MKTCLVTTLTPVHIGSGRHLQKDTEFITGNGRAVVIDDKKVLDVIGKQNIDRWVACINKGQSLMDLIHTINKDIEPDDIALRGMELYSTDIRNSQSLKEHMLSGGDTPFIPGSSIKGSIRTAVLNHLLEHLQKTPFLHDDIFIRDKINDKSIMRKYFGDSPNTDILRFLTVGDALFDFETCACNVLSMNIVSDGVRMEKKLGQVTECIPAGAESEIRININQKLLSKNSDKNYIKTDSSFLNSYTSLFGLINAHTSKLLTTEILFWEDEKENDSVAGYIDKLRIIADEITACNPGTECVLRVGHGSGWLGMTGGWAKEDKFIADQDTWDAIEDKARPRNRALYSEYPFPKTRRMDDEGELLGFVKITIK